MMRLDDMLTLAKTTLAKTVGFQEWCNDATAEACEDRIYFEAIPLLPIDDEIGAYDVEALNALRPFAIIWLSDEQSYIATRDAEPDGIRASGIIVIHLSKLVTELADNIESPTAIYEEVSRLISNMVYTEDPAEPGLLDLGTIAGNLNIHRVETLYGGRTPQNQRTNFGDAFDVYLRCHWGLQG